MGPRTQGELTVNWYPCHYMKLFGFFLFSYLFIHGFFFSCLQLLEHTVLNLTSFAGCRTWCPTDFHNLYCKALINNKLINFEFYLFVDLMIIHHTHLSATLHMYQNLSPIPHCRGYTTWLLWRHTCSCGSPLQGHQKHPLKTTAQHGFLQWHVSSFCSFNDNQTHPSMAQHKWRNLCTNLTHWGTMGFGNKECWSFDGNPQTSTKKRKYTVCPLISFLFVVLPYYKAHTWHDSLCKYHSIQTSILHLT